MNTTLLNNLSYRPFFAHRFPSIADIHSNLSPYFSTAKELTMERYNFVVDNYGEIASPYILYVQKLLIDANVFMMDYHVNILFLLGAFVFCLLFISCFLVGKENLEEECEEETKDKCRCFETVTTRYKFCNNLKDCEKFKIFSNNYPVFKHLIEDHECSFVKHASTKKYGKDEVTMVVFTAINMFYKLKDNKDKITLLFIIYDFILRNNEFVKEHKCFANRIFRKLSVFSRAEEFEELTTKYKINYNDWVEQINTMCR